VVRELLALRRSNQQHQQGQDQQARDQRESHDDEPPADASNGGGDERRLARFASGSFIADEVGKRGDRAYQQHEDARFHVVPTAVIAALRDRAADGSAISPA
jgi:hypothetical protein